MADHKNLLNTSILFILAESILFLSLNIYVADAGGPYRTAIRGPNVIQAGVYANFVCYADCTPACNYIWRVGRHTVLGPVVWVRWSGHQEFLKVDCTAIHPVTMNSVKVTKIVTIDNPVHIKPYNNSEPKDGQNFTLVCEGAGPNITTYWYKNNFRVYNNSRVHFGEDDGTLIFSPLLHFDEGYYECFVINGTRRVVSEGYLLSLGFIHVSILGPSVAESGVEHIFTCQANCSMECSTSWWFSHGLPQGSISVLGDEVHWTPAGSGSGFEQEFECVAENSLAQRLVQATKSVRIPARPTTAPPSGSVLERPSVALVFLVCLQMLFCSSI